MTLTGEEFGRRYLPHLADKLRGMRWFAGKSREIVAIELKNWGISSTEPRFYLPFLNVRYNEGNDEVYFYPFVAVGEENPEDATGSAEFIRSMVSLVTSGTSLPLTSGEIRGYANAEFKENLNFSNVRIVSAEQSNTSTVIDNSYIFKILRKVNPGTNPDYEVPQYLTSKGFRWTPEVIGKLESNWQNQSSHIGTLSKFIAGSEDAWAHFLRTAREFLVGADDDRSVKIMEELCESFRTLGKITSEMHNLLSQNSENSDFQPERITASDRKSYIRSYHELLWKVLAELKKLVKNNNILSAKADVIAELGNELAQFGERASESIPDALYKTRVHGDYHLGQILWKEGSFYIIDFEGEPMRPMEYRRRKFPPLKDIAGMMRSIDYLVETAGRNLLDSAQAIDLKNSLMERLSSSFLNSYTQANDAENPYLPSSDSELKISLLFFELEKVLYEIDYELNNRIEFAEIPMDSLIRYLKTSVTNKQN